MRLFIALKTNLDKGKIFSYEKSLMRTVSGVKWVEKENLHLTLKFLGETSMETKEDVSFYLSKIAETTSHFSFQYSGIDAFPDIRRARVIFVSVRNGKKIVSLMERVDDLFGPLGFKKEKSYIPHLTLGRVKNGYVDLKRFNLPQFKSEDVEATGILLVKSTLTKNGPIYQHIAEFDFG